MSSRTLMRGWPREYYRSTDPKGKCAICKNKENPYLAINYCCKKNHITCGVCFSMYSWNEDNKAYDCPKCIYEEFQQSNSKQRTVTLLEERMFVSSPEKGPNTFSYSAEAARKKAIREGRDPSTVIDREHVEKPPRLAASMKVESKLVESDNEDSDGPTPGSIFAKKMSQVNSSSSSSSSSSSKSEVIKIRSDVSSKSEVIKIRSDVSSKSEVIKIRSDVSSKSGAKKITYQGTEKEYVKVNVSEIDCDLCRCALCADCIWEVVTR